MPFAIKLPGETRSKRCMNCDFWVLKEADLPLKIASSAEKRSKRTAPSTLWKAALSAPLAKKKVYTLLYFSPLMPEPGRLCATSSPVHPKRYFPLLWEKKAILNCKRLLRKAFNVFLNIPLTVWIFTRRWPKIFRI